MKIESIRAVKANLIKRFWQTYDRTLRRAEKEGWTSLDDI